jgi:hypothetical protein
MVILLDHVPMQGRQEMDMKTITLTGMDEADLNKKQWDWQTTGSKKAIVKQWPDEILPRKMRALSFATKIEFSDQFSRRIDYEE